MRFLADGMLGRLARWLRFLGYDTVYYSHLKDQELARLARAEGRILLTRDTDLAKRRGIRCLLVESQELNQQLQQVFSQLNLSPNLDAPRCPVCNSVLEDTTPDAMSQRLPHHVRRAYSRFRRCPQCNRVYWPGTHWRRMRENLKSFWPPSL